MKITIIGGGNIGTLMAGEFAYKGHEVTIYTSDITRWNNEIDVLNQEGELLFKGKLTNVTSVLKEAVNEAEMIFITYPAQLFTSLNEEIKSYVKEGQYIGVVPGSGGAEFAFKDLIDKGAILFGLQRVHSISRLEKYGHSVHMLGRKKQLEVGTIPSSYAKEVSEILNKLFDLPCISLPNYLCVTLTPSNPILHTSRLSSMFKDYKEGMTYDHNILFYEEWTDESSSSLISMDNELQNLCNIIPLDLSNVMSLKEYYESPTVERMTNKISSIQAFKGITSPMKEVSNGWIPDFSSRYFSTDFPFGLKIIKDLCSLFGVESKEINRVWSWYESMCPDYKGYSFSLPKTIEEFVDLYK